MVLWYTENFTYDEMSEYLMSFLGNQELKDDQFMPNHPFLTSNQYWSTQIIASHNWKFPHLIQWLQVGDNTTLIMFYINHHRDYFRSILPKDIIRICHLL